MLIIIEDCLNGDKLIHGKRFAKRELENALKEILNTTTERDFISIFCARYGYEEIPYSDDVIADYIIDLDTHLVFTIH